MTDEFKVKGFDYGTLVNLRSCMVDRKKCDELFICSLFSINQINHEIEGHQPIIKDGLDAQKKILLEKKPARLLGEKIRSLTLDHRHLRKIERLMADIPTSAIIRDIASNPEVRPRMMPSSSGGSGSSSSSDNKDRVKMGFLVGDNLGADLED